MKKTWKGLQTAKPWCEPINSSLLYCSLSSTQRFRWLKNSTPEREGPSRLRFVYDCLRMSGTVRAINHMLAIVDDPFSLRECVRTDQFHDLMMGGVVLLWEVVAKAGVEIVFLAHAEGGCIPSYGGRWCLKRIIPRILEFLHGTSSDTAKTS